MPETCLICEYKRLTRRMLSTLQVLSRTIGLLSQDAEKTVLEITESYRAEFLALHAKQRSESVLPFGRADHRAGVTGAAAQP